MDNKQRAELEELLRTPVDPSQRTTYSYYRKTYTNPAPGDVIRAMHYNDDYDWLALVVKVVKDGEYMMVPLKGNIGAPLSRMDLRIAPGAQIYQWSFKQTKKEQSPNFIGIGIIDKPIVVEDDNLTPRNDDTASAIIDIVRTHIDLSDEEAENIMRDLLARLVLKDAVLGD